MTTYNYDPVPVYGSVGGLVRIGSRASATFAVTDLAGAPVTVVQGGVTQAGFVVSDGSGLLPSFSTVDVKPVRIAFIPGAPVTVQPREGGGGGTDTLTVANGTPIDLPDSETVGSTRGFVVTAPTVIEGTSRSSGTWVFVKEAGGWAGYQASSGSASFLTVTGPTQQVVARTYTIPNDPNVIYEAGGAVKSPGVYGYSSAAGGITITARPANGYAFSVGQTTSWSFTWAQSGLAPGDMAMSDSFAGANAPLNGRVSDSYAGGINVTWTGTGFAAIVANALDSSALTASSVATFTMPEDMTAFTMELDVTALGTGAQILFDDAANTSTKQINLNLSGTNLMRATNNGSFIINNTTPPAAGDIYRIALSVSGGTTTMTVTIVRSGSVFYTTSGTVSSPAAYRTVRITTTNGTARSMALDAIRLVKG